MGLINFIDIKEAGFASGLDQESAETQIAPGYAEDIVNMNPLPTGSVETRKGYQGRGGDLPIRATQLQYFSTSTNNIILTFNAAISFPVGRTQPLVISGRTSGANSANVGDFLTNSDSTHYYSSYSPNLLQYIPVGSGTLNIPEATHGINSAYLICDILASTNTGNYSNELVQVDSIKVNQTTKNIAIGYTNNTGASIPVYIVPADNSTGANAYAGSTTTAATNESILTGTNTYTIPLSVHSLTPAQFLVEVYANDGVDFERIIPDAVSINPTTAAVSITLSNNTGSAFDAMFFIRLLPTGNVTLGSVGAGGTLTLTSRPTTPWNLVQAYMENGSNLERILPDSIVYDDTTGLITTTLVNNSSSGANFHIFWDSRTIAANSISLTGAVIDVANVFTDSAPQLTVWGFIQSELYSQVASDPRPGWTTHLDTHRTTADNRLVAGLGGTICTEQFRTESGVASTYLLPLNYPNLLGRLNSDCILGPAFWGTGLAPARTRGTISGDNRGDNYFNITSIIYNSGTGYTDLTLTIPNMVITGSPISTTTNLNDWIQVSQTGYAANSGTFKIVDFSVLSSTQIKISVESANGSDFDETSSGAQGGIFTDQLTLSSTSQFILGDTLSSSLFADTEIHTALSTSGSTFVADGFLEKKTLPGGLRILATRTSSVIPLRDTSNFVRGDMIEYSNVERQLRILHINPNSDITLSISGVAGVATATLSSGDTGFLFVGCHILIRNSVSYNGTQVVTGINSLSQFTFSSSETATESATLIGSTIQVDEDLTWIDSIDFTSTISVPSRWIPMEIPQDSFNLTPKTRPRLLDVESYTNQSTMRSIMAHDTMFFSNGTHEVLKFDGSNVYRAGLPRWNPSLFITVDTSSTGKIVVSNSTISYDSIPTGTNEFVFTTTPDDANNFKVGDMVQDAQDLTIYFITSVTVNVDSTGASTKGIISVDKNITGSSGTKTLTSISQFKYYFRLNAVDSNNNVVASAISASSDNLVSLGANAAVRLRLVSPPAFDVYDYDRLEVQISRTKANSVAPFYTLTNIPLQFNSTGGYIDYLDTTSDAQLITQDVVNTALKGANLGTGFTEPLIAKLCTSAGNRLVLANLTGFPTLDLKFLPTKTVCTQSTFVNSSNAKYLFLKDVTDTGTTTDNLNRMNFQFVNSGAVKIRNISSTFTFIDGDVDIATDVITHAAHGMSTGDLFQLSNSGGALPVPLAASTNYYCISTGVNTFKVATSIVNAQSGTAIDITSAAGGGTHTLTPASNIIGSGSNFVVSSISHGLSAGDWVYLFNSNTTGQRLLTWAGLHQINSVTTHTFTINSIYSTTSATLYDVDSYVSAPAPADIPVWLGADGNIDAVGMNNSSTDPCDFIAGVRLAAAINSSMRKVDISITSQKTFTPWMIANAGNDYSSGQVVIRSQQVLLTTLGIKLPSLTGDFSVYLNSNLAAGGSKKSAVTNLYPSRLIMSYANYPEIFDNPEAASEVDSDSVIDINSSDGEEVTAIMPFFGEAAYGAAQKSGVVVVWKGHSIYVVDLNAKAAGQPAIQRLDTRGVGCTAPFSPAVARQSIMFVNENTIYRLNTSLTLDIVGRKYRRKWASLNLDEIDLCAGHNNHNIPAYQVSYPNGEETENRLVAVYSHIKEDTLSTVAGGSYTIGIGAWSTFDNHPAVLWCSLGGSDFFASTTGRVFKMRNLGDVTDCRDDNQPISQQLLLRALDAGDSSRRKVWSRVVTQFRNPSVQINQVSLKSAVDLHTTFSSTDAFTLRAVTPTQDGLGDQTASKGISIASTLQERNGIHLQLLYTLNQKDTPIEIAGVDIRAGVKGDKGVTQAASTN